MKPPLVLAAGLALAFAIAGCTLGTPATPSPTPPKLCCGPPTPTATASPTSTPTATPSPTVPPITLPTPGGTAAAPCPTNPVGEPAVPPDAHITSASGGAYSGGELGSYTFCGTSADALPPRAASVSAVDLGAAPARVQMDGGWGITGLKAGYWPAAVWQGDETALADERFAEPAIGTTFSGPPAGDWMLALHVTFPADGNATYYWHVTVP